MTKRLSLVFSLLLVLVLYPFQQLKALDQNDGKPNSRIELSTAYEYLSPHSGYGDWKTISLSYYRTGQPDFTWYTQFFNFSRPEGSGQLAAVGAYKDWSRSFYTYTALAAGTETDYLPKTRIDHNFNFKFGQAKNWIWSLGGSYLQYSGEQKDYILSTGFTAYRHNSVAEYRIFRNQSYPGAVGSYSYLLSFGVGQERKQWTTATFSAGKQAYLATYLVKPEKVNKNSKMISFNHRRWLDDHQGIFGDLSWLDLEESYRKTGFSLGYFSEF
ncbi:YaiO family outer membrane beta-barrel protein [Sporomusa aerivorans]|uniref:YaiO family outer membrane beta-barrel protein n=1 Tax=Sporomusa aerivorans TaxID=204936 RepID=UPI00352A5A55